MFAFIIFLNIFHISGSLPTSTFGVGDGGRVCLLALGGPIDCLLRKKHPKQNRRVYAEYFVCLFQGPNQNIT